MLQYYYSETLKNMTVALLERFSHMEVHRFNKEHTEVVKVIEVPIAFAPVEKLSKTDSKITRWNHKARVNDITCKFHDWL